MQLSEPWDSIDNVHLNKFQKNTITMISGIPGNEKLGNDTNPPEGGYWHEIDINMYHWSGYMKLHSLENITAPETGTISYICVLFERHIEAVAI